ncbi:MAG TPA: lysophospholipid acyltransferase family protein [Byssovorax sp.]|jgi:1-acyl-sn-glycerol-3-phosphate acyltransferase
MSTSEDPGEGPIITRDSGVAAIDGDAPTIGMSPVAASAPGAPPTSRADTVAAWPAAAATAPSDVAPNTRVARVDAVDEPSLRARRRAAGDDATLQSSGPNVVTRETLEAYVASVTAKRAEAAAAGERAAKASERADLERQIATLQAKLRGLADAGEGAVSERGAPRFEERLGAVADEVDELGYDAAYEARLLPALDFLYTTYFRVETAHADRIPRVGRCIVVANHSGGPLPYDGVMLRTAVRRELAGARDLRWLTEDFISQLPFVGTAMNRLGAVRACQENATRLLARGGLVAVFPEGAKGMGKLYKDRYKLQRFGRGGFIRLALRTRTPVVPCAVVGAEEANPLLLRVEAAAKALGLPYVPVTPTFPALGPLGLLPAPTKWRIEFGEPLAFDEHGEAAAEDDVTVGRLAERVRGTIQGMLDRAVSSRRSVWFG